MTTPTSNTDTPQDWGEVVRCYVAKLKGVLLLIVGILVQMALNLIRHALEYFAGHTPAWLLENVGEKIASLITLLNSYSEWITAAIVMWIFMIWHKREVKKAVANIQTGAQADAGKTANP